MGARVGAALKVLPRLKPTSTVLVHDWPRSYARDIMEHFTLVDTVPWDEKHRQDGGLAILKPKASSLGSSEASSYLAFIDKWARRALRV